MYVLPLQLFAILHSHTQLTNHHTEVIQSYHIQTIILLSHQNQSNLETYVYIVESNNKLCILSVSLSFFLSFVCCVCALSDVLGEVGTCISFLSRFPSSTQEFFPQNKQPLPSLKNGAKYPRSTRLERIRVHVLFVTRM